MNVTLARPAQIRNAEIKVPGSKSETNRMLLLQAIIPEIILDNTSDSDDSVAMRTALASTSNKIDVGHAGTAMRFLTAYFASRANRVVTLTGSGRMKQRPIKVLVDALRTLGADIDYLESDGFPPLKISGKSLHGREVSLDAAISSQYISALLLIAPKLYNGLKLTLTGEITSRPYIEMTLSLLNEIGVETSFDGNEIEVYKTEGKATSITIESDWSSASYFFSIAALAEIGTEIALSTFKINSRQGDSKLVEIYTIFGVETKFDNNRIVLRKVQSCLKAEVELDMNTTPDLAQTIAVTAFGLGIKCTLTGLHTLRIKETDRIAALQSEFEKLGAAVTVTNRSITIEPAKIRANISIKTYDDHRMAMAFAPLALKVPIVIQDAEVVSKSYTTFWSDLKNLGLEVIAV